MFDDASDAVSRTRHEHSSYTNDTEACGDAAVVPLPPPPAATAVPAAVVPAPTTVPPPPAAAAVATGGVLSSMERACESTVDASASLDSTPST